MNVITTEEASKKWCPLVRNLYIEGDKAERRTRVATNYNADRTHNKCISTNCMLWRETDPGKGYCGISPLAAAL